MGGIVVNTLLLIDTEATVDPSPTIISASSAYSKVCPTAVPSASPRPLCPTPVTHTQGKYLKL